MTPNVRRMLKILNIPETEVNRLEDISHRELPTLILKLIRNWEGKACLISAP